MGVGLTVLITVTPGMLRAVSIIAFSFSSFASPVCPTWLRSKSANIAPCGCMPSGVCRARTMPCTAASGAVTSSVQQSTPSNRSRSVAFYLIHSSCCRHSILYSQYKSSLSKRDRDWPLDCFDFQLNRCVGDSDFKTFTRSYRLEHRHLQDSFLWKGGEG